MHGVADERYFRERILPFNAGAKGRAEAARVLALLAARAPAGAVLDLGCGAGCNALRLRDEGRRAVGAEPAPAGLRLAAERGVPELVRCEAERAPFRAGSFAGVLATHVLGHVRDLGRALAEVQRLLVPGGVLVASTPNARFVEVLRAQNERGLVPYARDTSVRRYLDAAELERALRAAGFVAVEVEAFGDPPALPPGAEPSDVLPAGVLPADLGDPGRRERLLAVAVRG